MMKNIFLDFLNRDSRQIYGTYSNFSNQAHVELLNEAINVAVFLCNEYCIMPPGFLAEDAVLRTAFERCREYAHNRIIRMPLREESLAQFFDKKLREYELFRNKYADLFSQEVQQLLRGYAIALTPRESNVTIDIIHQWEDGPDKPGPWSKLKDRVPSSEIERIRHIPRAIHNDETAVTWASLEGPIGQKIGVDPRELRNVLQHDYFGTYLREFDLTIVTRLPFSRTSFGLESGSLAYDFEALRGALSPLGLWPIVLAMSAPSMLRFRDTAGYFEFRHAFDTIAKHCDSTRNITHVFALAKAQTESDFTRTAIIDRHASLGGLSIPYGLSLDHETLEAMSFRLSAVSGQAVEIAAVIEQTNSRQDRQLGPVRLGERAMSRMIAIYVALDMERNILIRDLGLVSRYPNTGHAGKLGPFDVIVFSRNEMGRVPAAIATLKFLQEHKEQLPQFLIVAGIAGGFEKEGCRLGDLIVATSVVDLAMRKVRQEEDHITVPEFRPQQFATDTRVRRYLNDAFNVQEWQRNVTNDVDWPEGQYPSVRFGSISSMDEVVSSNEWADKLLGAFPKLLGVEMEAGGVCAAAAEFQLPVSVIRGVSDKADPAKSDDEWRKRAMRTVSHLIRTIDFARIV